MLRARASILCSLLWLATLVAGLPGGRGDLVMCVDADGHSKVELAHASHDSCHAEADAADASPAADGPFVVAVDGCTDFAFGTQHPDRPARSASADHLFVFAPAVFATVATVVDSAAPGRDDVNGRFDPHDTLPDGELAALRAVVLVI